MDLSRSVATLGYYRGARQPRPMSTKRGYRLENSRWMFDQPPVASHPVDYWRNKSDYTCPCSATFAHR